MEGCGVPATAVARSCTLTELMSESRSVGCAVTENGLDGEGGGEAEAKAVEGVGTENDRGKYIMGSVGVKGGGRRGSGSETGG